MKFTLTLRATCCSAALAFTWPAVAQENASTPAASDQSGIENVIVTAQRRDEHLQSVPVAVTAFSQADLREDHIHNVKDLDSAAPGLTVQTNAGGQNALVATLRGENATADVPGQSGGVAVYIDDVYYGLATGTVFDLADISSMEVLRGPQGTLFGRNANGGAILIATHAPTGEFGIQEQLTIGNYDEIRSKTRVDLPAWGPLSASITYLHTSREGDITNLGGGTQWNWGPATGGAWGIRTSPNHLGDVDANAISGAIEYKPNASLDVVERFDYTNMNHSDVGQGILGNPNDESAALGVFQPLYDYFDPPGLRTPISSKRPDDVNNWFAGLNRELVYGDSVTATYALNDMISFKDIASYRGDVTNCLSDIFSMGGVNFGGLPYIPTAASGSRNKENQITEEAQVNVTTNAFLLTAGYFLYYNRMGDGPAGEDGSLGGPSISGGQVFGSITQPYLEEPTGAIRSLADSFSQAIYAQGTYHLTDLIDVTGGARQTWDHTYGIDNINASIIPPVAPGYAVSYVHGKLTWLGDVDYKPTDDVFVYGKVNTGYVAGGELGGLSYGPESVLSYEVGTKIDLLNHTLRTNVAVYDARYTGLQQIEALPGTFVTVIANIADADTRGVELEETWLPPFIDGLELSAGLSYSDFEFSKINSTFLAVNGTTANHVLVPNRPKTTFTPAAQYEVDGMPWNGGLLLRVEGKFRSSENLNYDWFTPSMRDLIKSDPQMIVDARVALTQFPLGPVRAEVAAWAKNLTNDRNAESAIYLGAAGEPGFASANFEPARTYGIDIDVDY